jgi:hypothetical protein
MHRNGGSAPRHGESESHLGTGDFPSNSFEDFVDVSYHFEMMYIVSLAGSILCSVSEKCKAGARTRFAAGSIGWLQG